MDGSYATSIELSQGEIFRNLRNAKRFAVDIGGSLAKIAYLSTVRRRMSLVLDETTKDGDKDHIYKVAETSQAGDTLHFVKFETKYIGTCLDFILKNLIESPDAIEGPGKVIKATGSGTVKYMDLLTSKLELQVDKEDEIECLIKGCNFLLKNIPDEAFHYQHKQQPEFKFQVTDPNIFPYLLVNIGSGVSIIQVESENQYKRVGGSSIGGGTFWGLGTLLTGAKGFDELLLLAEKGDHRNTDILVKDTCSAGGVYTSLGLPDDLIASSFGKAAKCWGSPDKQASPCMPEDIVRSLLITISNNIGQIACLLADQYKLETIYFGGYFIRGHPMTMHTITHAINYWSEGRIHPLFLRHEGYLGAIGAFLKGAEDDDDTEYSWSENYAGSSGLQSPKSKTCDMLYLRDGATFDMLHLEKFDKPLVSCPLLLDAASYFPDTVDLMGDAPARQYWLKCFEDATDRFMNQAIKSDNNTENARQRAQQFKEKYIQRLYELRENPCAYGSLTVRCLLDTREHFLKEFNFIDPYSQQKQLENEHALKLFQTRLDELDGLSWDDRQVALAEGMLAGNVFDWGAKEIVKRLEAGEKFGFAEAKSELQSRPWLFDDFEAWLERLRGPCHKCAVIFCDNSGFDIILGIVPFAIELLQRGTKVLLCANSKPALNDVTSSELTILMKRISDISDHVAVAISSGQLRVMESGQGSPCLDLRYIDYGLSQMIQDCEADLIVMEGMGRAVHTNFAAKFKCESLKVAVLKNKWLAERLGGKMYSAMFKYEKSSYVTCRS
ncbi:4'-phosphopantetheine phosphatase-like [Lineus longissimus]|uniref:4'-phosphopantetheine phosphatase-like n=1 Tax=Lineus longissimus TaxID=88925 RepID=UPI002B4CD79D